MLRARLSKVPEFAAGSHLATFDQAGNTAQLLSMP
jgi:hypothetical protein